MNSSVSLSHEKPHQYPVQDGIKHDLICKVIVLQINIPSASYIDFIFKHNRKANMSLVCLRKGHTFNCRACCRIIVHFVSPMIYSGEFMTLKSMPIHLSVELCLYLSSIRVPNSPFDFDKYDHHQVACSVCMKTRRVSTIVIPARNWYACSILRN
jgi:hypothetical protein